MKNKKEAKKMGRPRINSESCQVYKYIPIRPEDHLRIKTKALTNGMTMVDYMSFLSKKIK